MGSNNGDSFWLRWGLFVAMTCIVAFLIVGCSASAQVAPPSPNIVFVLADDMRADDLASMDRLVTWSQGGTRFTENAFHTTPQCCPARTTMLTGKYAHNHGVKQNPKTGTRTGYEVFKNSGAGKSYLPTWLDDAGYATGVFGKFLNGYQDNMPPPPGFDVAKITDMPPGDTRAMNGAEVFFRRSVAKDRPAFAAVWLRSPHDPLGHPPGYKGDFDAVERELTPAYDEADVSEKVGFIEMDPLTAEQHKKIEDTWRTRLEMSRRIEEAVLQMTRAAEETGQLDNTYFLVSSDNGFFLGEHRIKSGKALPYDATARNFLLFKGPGIVAQERIELVTDNDVAPTLAELVNVPVPEGYALDGRSLAPLLHGETLPTWRTATLIEHPAPPINNDPKTGYKAVRTTDELYIEWEGGHVEHYADDYQTEPANDPARQAELEVKLDALNNCAGDSCREAEDAP